MYALLGLRVAWFSAVSLFILARERSPMGSGGIGSVVAVDAIVFPYLLLALASIVANRMLAGWAHRSERPLRIVHAAHGWSIVLAFVVVIASVGGVGVARGPLPLLLLPLSGVVWGIQFVATAALLGAYTFRTARMS